MEKIPKLYKCEQSHWKWMPAPLRFSFAWLSLIIFSVSFLTAPLCVFFIFPVAWIRYPIFSGICLTSIMVSLILPMREWVWARKIGQLWYDVFDFSCNLSEEDRSRLVALSENSKFIISMHPHGIVPIQGLLWAAYSDQYLTNDDKRSVYGFGGAADVVFYIPFLRNILGWFSVASASYKTLKNGIDKGEVPVVNAVGRIPRHLFILSGGIAEVFTSRPGSHIVVMKNRKGLMKLSLETGAMLLPSYVFGGNDFFYNIATGDNLLSQLSRRLRMGITMFYGQFGLPIPFHPKVTMVIADPIPVEKWNQEGGEPVSTEAIDKLHEKYLESITSLFEKYKIAAGYPDAKLQII